jgi:hypothetical protein
MMITSVRRRPSPPPAVTRLAPSRFRFNRILPLALAALTFALVGCGGDHPVTGGASAGPTPVDPYALPRARLVEELRLDAEAEDFSVVSRILVGPSGQIALPLLQDRQIWIYEAEGRRVAVTGRRGSGPGEFQNLGPAGWLGDTIWVHDRTNDNRITYIGPDGTLLRTSPLPNPLRVTPPGGDAPRDLLVFMPATIFSDGAMLGGGYYMIPELNRISTFQMVYLAPSGDARIVAEPPSSSDDPRWTLVVEGFYRAAPFAMQPQSVVMADGNGFATLYAEPAPPDGVVATLTMFASDGDTLFTREYAMPATPVPASVRDSVLAAILPAPGAPPPTEGPADLRQRFHAQARERAWPVYAPVTAVRSGLDDTLWLDLRETDDGRITLVLDARGEPVGTVPIPERSVIRQASRTHLWVTETDALGLASVVRYRVEGLAPVPRS